MGCLSSKHAVSFDSPIIVHSKDNGIEYIPGFSSKHLYELNRIGYADEDGGLDSEDRDCSHHSRTLKKGNGDGKVNLSKRLVGAEHVAAGWPSWLSSAAAEAVDGWLPLQADGFEKLEKIGQGTYSSVFRARELKTGRLVALKKVQFDNFQPESIRFMAREILILRRLDHPNIMKLEGIITSRTSSSIYLVFEYMEHDLAGLSSSPDIKFSEPQIKCYMKQLLWALEHCHLRGIVHRDIKASNILVNNEGVLKLGDFGLANVITPRNKNKLTSRVVTLWYRAPELLMGSTSYGVSVDMWSVGCVFAEIILGKPMLKGRTEIEQLHKIFKLSGSPPEEYWKKSKLSHPSMFKPQNCYESTLRERFKDFPTSATNLLETLLSIEPENRGTASSALNSEYFNSRPYPCDPSSLPKYPPNKELDAKHREEQRRKKAGIKTRESGATKKSRLARRIAQDTKGFSKLAPKEETQDSRAYQNRNNNGSSNPMAYRGRESAIRRGAMMSSLDTVSETSQLTTTTEGNYSGLSQATAPGGFALAKRRKDDNVSLLRSQVSGMSVFEKKTFG